MQKIKVIIPLKGISLGLTQIKVETEGFTGAACQNATEALQKLLGTTTSTELKAEFYATTDAQYETHNEG